jgi:hypothetical protein
MQANRAPAIDDALAVMRFFRSSDKPCVPICAMQGYLEKPPSSRKRESHFAQLVHGLWIPGGNDDSLVFRGDLKLAVSNTSTATAPSAFGMKIALFRCHTNIIGAAKQAGPDGTSGNIKFIALGIDDELQQNQQPRTSCDSPPEGSIQHLLNPTSGSLIEQHAWFDQHGVTFLTPSTGRSATALTKWPTPYSSRPMKSRQ